MNRGYTASDENTGVSLLFHRSRAKIGFVFEASKTSAKSLIEAMGGGVAMIDADGDGNLDLYFCESGLQLLRSAR